MYKIKITANARKDLKNISKLHLSALSEIFLDLKEDPLIGKPLTRELTGRYSYRVGFYRIIYKFNEKDKTIFILAAGHRSIVYK